MPNIYGTQLQQSLVVYLGKKVHEMGLDAKLFGLYQYPNQQDLGTFFGIACKTCGDKQERIVCDWSEGYDLDGMTETVVSFCSNHRHGVAEPKAEEPKTGRKFRD